MGSKLISNFKIKKTQIIRIEFYKSFDFNRNSEKKKIKEMELNCLENVKTLPSKIIYSQFLFDSKKSVKLDSGYDKEEQTSFCTMLHEVDLSSNERIINYKIM